MSSKDASKERPTNANGVPLFKSDVTNLDVKLDKEIVYEFGGPVGVTAMVNWLDIHTHTYATKSTHCILDILDAWIPSLDGVHDWCLVTS